MEKDKLGNKLNKYGFRENFDWNNRFDLKTEIGDYEVSTVDLGLDHSFGGEKPLYYETMIFLKENIGKFVDRKKNIFEDYQMRYSTEEEAKIGHKLAIEYVEEVLKSKTKDEDDKDIPLIPDDELWKIENNDATNYRLNYNFKVLKEKINQVVKEFNEYRKDK